MRPNFVSLISVCLFISLHLPSSRAQRLLGAERYDVVIYGGTSGGVIAAVQCSRMGKKAVLIEPTKFLGGLTTGGLGATDIGNKRAIGGLSREFYQRIHKAYLEPNRWTQESREAYLKDRVKTEDTMWTFEPSVASKILDDMIAEAKVPVIFGERLDLKKGVVKTGARIMKIVMESGRQFEASVFIDATYEGDLMAKAGVSYHVGRESNSTYGETINGLQIKGAVHHQFVKKIDPFVKRGDPASGLLSSVTPMPIGNDGDGDHRIQAYNFRLCTTDKPENRRPWPKPEGYDERQFELLLRNFDAADNRVPWHPLWMPNRKTDTNNNFAFSTDAIGMNYEYPDGDYAVREKIWKAHELYTQGLMWTLANHPRVPENVRTEFNRIALTKDEFLDNDNWPRQLYVREARRMISDYVMSEKNCKREEIVPDSVGMGAYNMDSHNTQRYVTPDGFARNEGDIQIATRPYPISYRSLRPKETECTNLIVPICMAASHVAYGSIRMEPVFMVLGQSAATAAVHSINEQTNVQTIDVAQLQRQLLKDGQVLDFESSKPVSILPLKKEDLGGIVLDDDQAELTGFSEVGQSVAPFVGAGYRHDGDTGKGLQTARFTPDIPKLGNYRVSVMYPAANNRATNVPVMIRSFDGDKIVILNQKKSPSETPFQPIGTFRFEAGRRGFVEFSNNGTDGHVIVDCVQWNEILP